MDTRKSVLTGWRGMAAVALGVAVLGGGPLRAQGGTTTTGDTAITTTTTTQQDDDRDFPWGLLGLLGLAGLLGRRRPDVVRHDEVHVRPAPRADDVSLRTGGDDLHGRPLTGTERVNVRPADPAGPSGTSGPLNP
jgi:MYXO-CTERM domain-containing protein